MHFNEKNVFSMHFRILLKRTGCKFYFLSSNAISRKTNTLLWKHWGSHKTSAHKRRPRYSLLYANFKAVPIQKPLWRVDLWGHPYVLTVVPCVHQYWTVHLRVNMRASIVFSCLLVCLILESGKLPLNKADTYQLISNDKIWLYFIWNYII